VLPDAFIFLKFRNTILLRGAWRMKSRKPIQVNSHSNHPSTPESVRRTKSTPVRLCLAGPNIVQWHWTLFGIQKLSPMASFLREPYKYPSTSNGSLPWPVHSSGAKVHLLHLQMPQTLTPRDFTPSSWSGDWVKPRSEFRVLISSSSLSWLLNLHHLCFLLFELCSYMVRGCPWATTLCGEHR
jgi:hypothetical protein